MKELFQSYQFLEKNKEKSHSFRQVSVYHFNSDHLQEKIKNLIQLRVAIFLGKYMQKVLDEHKDAQKYLNVIEKKLTQYTALIEPIFHEVFNSLMIISSKLSLSPHIPDSKYISLDSYKLSTSFILNSRCSGIVKIIVLNNAIVATHKVNSRATSTAINKLALFY